MSETREPTKCQWCRQCRVPRDGKHFIVTTIGNRTFGEYVACEKVAHA